ncbi:MAG: S-layer homology domain-containing protein [Peptococcaceae bacterium]
MININRKRKLIIIGIFTLLFSWGLLGSAGAADSPDITVTVGTNGVISPSSDTLILHTVDYPDYDGPWCPGLAKAGTLRITYQGFGRLGLSNVGLVFDDQPTLENFELTLDKITTSSYLDRNESADFKYTVKMKEDAGRGLSGRSATLAFTVTLTETVNNSSDDDDDDDDDLVTEPFVEMPSIGGHWAVDCVGALLENSLIKAEIDVNVSNNYGNSKEANYTDVWDNGYLDGPITRGEVAVFLGRALSLEDKAGGINPYNDKIPAFARGYIIATYEAGIFSGYPDYTSGGRVFKSDNYITREELTCALIKAFNKILSGEINLNFQDAGQISSWALGGVKTSVQNGIIGGFPDNTFRPKDYMTRAETFAVICRLLGYHTAHTN